MKFQFETIDEYLNRGGKIKKVDFSTAHNKGKWGRSRWDYFTKYKLKKENQSNLRKNSLKSKKSID